MFFSGSGSLDSLFEGLDSRLRVCTRNSHRDYGMEKKFGSGLRHNRTLLWTLCLDMFCLTGALQLITWVITHGRAARGNLTTTYINTAKGYWPGDLNCRPRYKYHVKSPKHHSGNSYFFLNISKKF